jgi:aminocarboxymuconate-semialdehyde decarboxylase
VVYRPFPRGGFDLAHRLRDMDAMGVDVSCCPPRRNLSLQPGCFAGATTAAIQKRPDCQTGKAESQRFMGIATLPMQAPEKPPTS